MPRANADAITAAQISLEEAAKPTPRIFRNAMTLAFGNNRGVIRVFGSDDASARI